MEYKIIKKYEEISELTKRENEVFLLIIKVIKGNRSLEIANSLGISINTVKFHRKNINSKVAISITAVKIQTEK
jgi:DNA-binding CsgD family transcriptional regulator